MTIAVQTGPASTLSTVIAQLASAFQAMANPIPVMVGAAYEKDHGVGATPRVHVAPEKGSGKIKSPVEMGNAPSMVHSCVVSVRAPEGTGDVDRFDAAYALADLVIDCLSVAGSGRIEWGALSDDSPSDTASYGVGLKFSFTFERDIRHDPNRWRLPFPTASTARPYQSTPDNRGGLGAEIGEMGNVDTITPTVTVTETTP